MACISMETVQNEMHGGQAIPAFDFYLAPYVRSSYVEEIKTIESLSGIDLKHLYDAPIEDYITRELDFLQGDERFKQHAINRTVNRVHQSMEAFIHNMNTIHSRGGNQVVIRWFSRQSTTEQTPLPRVVVSFVSCCNQLLRVLVAVLLPFSQSRSGRRNVV